MKAAYADPPYLGCGKSHYGALHANAADFDDPETHRRLIEQLSDENDCWALSLHEPSLRVLLPMCPQDCRTAIWIKPFAAFKKNVTRAYCWEPFIFRFHRKRPVTMPTWRDFVIEPITMRRGFTGAKPERVCHWMFDGLLLEAGDDFTDLFPGSGAVGRAWESWKARTPPEQLTLTGAA